jgi:hypothetical protein
MPGSHVKTTDRRQHVVADWSGAQEIVDLFVADAVTVLTGFVAFTDNR